MRRSVQSVLLCTWLVVVLLLLAAALTGEKSWLNINSGAVVAIITHVLVGITAFYAWETARIANSNAATVSELREQRHDQARPVLVLRPSTIPAGGGSFSLRRPSIGLANVGLGPALRIAVAFEPHQNLPRFAVAAWFAESLPMTLAPGDSSDLSLLDPDGNPVLLIWMNTQRTNIVSSGSVGTIRIAYEDVYGRSFTSNAILKRHSVVGQGVPQDTDFEYYLLPTEIEGPT